jgi:predicted nicotinamide N-methyase
VPAPEHLESVPETTAAERAVADLLPIDSEPEEARAALERVPLWFHTVSLNGAGVYTPGIARDHRYRLPAIPDDFAGARVLDAGTFDGFYAFLAERRGAAHVVAVDNEQYVAWVRHAGRPARRRASGTRRSRRPRAGPEPGPPAAPAERSPDRRRARSGAR